MRHHCVGVVAHPSRLDMAEKLAELSDAVTVSVDTTAVGVTGNHRTVWERLAKHHSEWSVCLEDDAIPVDGFLDQLKRALEAAPSQMVGLYLGRVRPVRFQRRTRSATERADRNNACWITSTHLLHCVGYAATTTMAPMIAAALTRHTNSFPEEAVSRAAIRARTPVAHCWPSLVDHNDQIPSLVALPGMIVDRVAWRAGGRGEWSDKSVPL